MQPVHAGSDGREDDGKRSCRSRDLHIRKSVFINVDGVADAVGRLEIEDCAVKPRVSSLVSRVSAQQNGGGRKRSFGVRNTYHQLRGRREGHAKFNVDSLVDGNFILREVKNNLGYITFKLPCLCILQVCMHANL